MATVRKAESKDINQLTELMYEYIVDFYQRPKPPMEKVHQLFYTLLNQKEGAQFVVEQNEELVGFATLYFIFDTLFAHKVAILNDLYVTEEARGTDIAHELFQACHHFAEENNYAYMSWLTANDNKRAQRFYEKMGGISEGWVHYSIQTNKMTSSLVK
ncbi:GNAT family N-acetyltransferase [Priestia megaterium]|uniref:GNAT family N-acetyltransferase n=1 Tax=Priestia megaterium TaxID=1404 RepID=UPI002E23E212|nr:GNAT family N-acetyltransferase [Priestia megaterium]